MVRAGTQICSGAETTVGMTFIALTSQHSTGPHREELSLSCPRFVLELLKGRGIGGVHGEAQNFLRSDGHFLPDLDVEAAHSGAGSIGHL